MLLICKGSYDMDKKITAVKTKKSQNNIKNEIFI
jgi:hypothetical protein